jgi:hypothetical protein
LSMTHTSPPPRPDWFSTSCVSTSASTPVTTVRNWCKRCTPHHPRPGLPSNSATKKRQGRTIAARFS